MVDLTPYKDAIDAAKKAMPFVCHDPRAAFADELEAAGFSPPYSLVIDNIDRIKGPEDKAGKKNGWYIYREVADTFTEGAVIGIASFGCWKTGIQENWCSKPTHQMSVQESIAHQQIRAAMKAAQDAEKIKAQNEAAARAFKLWQEAEVATAHPYLAKKGVKAAQGLKIAKDDRLIIPLAFESQIVTLQFVNDAGEKRFLSGGRTKGAWFKIEGDANVVYIAEGYATGASVHEATGATCYIAFNAGNLFEVAMAAKNHYPTSKLIIAGDDDVNTPGNPGRTKATQAAEGLCIDAIFPEGFIDFNDLHAAKGIDALKECFVQKIQAYKKPKNKSKEVEAERPPGILGSIADYYNATSGSKQPGFAIQTSLALASIILGRCFKTSEGNYSSLYLLNVAKSGTGKEHSKTIIEKILRESNQSHLVAGDGYTSAGAVFSALLHKPKHISVIDEFGRYLESGRDLKKGNAHQREANTKLMEAIGRNNSVLRPPSYSTMTLKKEDAKNLVNRLIENPAITLLTMTTPDTLFSTLDMSAIKDGFINRFIISISSAERTIRRGGMGEIDVPQSILNWINAVTMRYNREHTASEPAEAHVIVIDNEAMEVQYEFQQYCIDQANYLERFGMSELPGRSNEMAMRISMIAALADDCTAEVIEAKHMKWAVNYVKGCLEQTMDKLKISISSSPFEHAKKEILHALREYEEHGITWARMQKTAPFSQHKPKDLKEILSALKDAELAEDTIHTTPKGGRPTSLWIPLR